MNEKTKKAIKITLSIILAAIFTYWAFKNVNLHEFWTDLTHTKWIFIVLSMLAFVAAMFFRVERWRMQLLPLDSGIKRSAIWNASNIGNFLNLALPGIGEIARCGGVTTKAATFDKTFGTMIVERAWDILSILALLVAAILSDSEKLIPFMRDNVIIPFRSRFNLSFWWLLLIIAVVLAAAVFAIFKFKDKNSVCAKIVKAFQGISTGITAFGQMKKGWLFILYTIGIWAMYILVTYFIFLAIPGLDHLTFADALFVSAVGNLATVIPTPGNVGPYHWLVGLSISTIYLNSSTMTSLGLLCATLSHGSHAILVVVLGVVSYICVAISKKDKV